MGCRQQSERWMRNHCRGGCAIFGYGSVALERFLEACPSQGRVLSFRGMPVCRKRGPVAQLGARFHGMEDVDGSNPSRSTKTFHRLSTTGTVPNVTFGVQMDPGSCRARRSTSSL